MKNLHFLLWVILFPLFMEACSSDELDNTIVQEENEISKIEAILSPFDIGETESRTAFNFGNTSVDTPVWAEGDIIGIYPSAGGDQLSFPIIEGVGTKNCVFTGGGWALKASTATETYTYTAYSPFNRNYYMLEDNKALPISMIGQKQTGNNNSSHLGAYHIQIANGDTPTSGKISFKFKHKVAFVRMDIIAPCAATWKSITLESNATFTTQATMNLSLDVPTITSTAQSNSVTLELDNVETTANDPSIVAYMAMLPVDFTDKTLTMKLTDIDENVYTAPVSIENPRNVETPHVFNAGAARWIKAVFCEKAVTLSEGGKLSSMLSDEEKKNLTSLRIEGPLNGDDINILRQMLGSDKYSSEKRGKLVSLDLSKARIVEGGQSYFSTYITENGNLNKKEIYTSSNVIGEYMFYNCDNLQYIILPNNITSIEQNSFAFCENINSLIIPQSVVSIGFGAFIDCKALNYIYIPNNVTSIDESAFQGCSSLNSIVIPNKVSIMSLSVFQNCTSLSTIEIPIGTTLIEDYAFAWCSSLTSVIIPDEVTSIGNSAFYKCEALASVKIGDNVTTINGHAFQFCTSLDEVSIGKSVNHIGESAFHKCSITKCYCYNTTPPSLTIGTNSSLSDSMGESAILYVPKGTKTTYESSEWANYFTNIVEMKE